MDADRINYLLRRKGWSQVEIAKALGMSKASVGNVIHSRVTSHVIATFISCILEREIDKIWPGRYHHTPRAAARTPLSPDTEGPPMT
jgi:lambda repressor-like predicted transcriptional regulator